MSVLGTTVLSSKISKQNPVGTQLVCPHGLRAKQPLQSPPSDLTSQKPGWLFPKNPGTYLEDHPMTCKCLINTVGLSCYKWFPNPLNHHLLSGAIPKVGITHYTHIESCSKNDKINTCKRIIWRRFTFLLVVQVRWPPISNRKFLNLFLDE